MLFEYLRKRLLASQHADGGWPYTAGADSAAEPTALGCLALSERSPALAGAAGQCLVRQQRDDGSVPARPGAGFPGWPTALAVVAWAALDREEFRPAIARAAKWITNSRGETINAKLSKNQHDATIPGWSWVEGTHAWVEPTAYCVLALRSVGMANHPRTRQGVQLLLDRAIPTGGWNYGSTEVLGNMVRPFPETTGVALAALAGEPRSPEIQNGIEFLLRELPRIRSALSIGWGLIGLHAWSATPAEGRVWLRETVELTLEREPKPVYDALLCKAAERLGMFENCEKEE